MPNYKRISRIEIELDRYDLRVLKKEIPLEKMSPSDDKQLVQIIFREVKLLGCILYVKKTVKKRYVNRRRLLRVLMYRKEKKINKACVLIMHANDNRKVIVF